MTYCEECCAIEQGTKTVFEDGDEVEVCASCGFPADEVMKNYDEDYGQER